MTDDQTDLEPTHTTDEALSEREPGSKLNDNRLDSIAMMTLKAMGPAAISRLSGVSETTIAALQAGRNEQFNRILQAYRQKLFDGMLSAEIKLVELLPSCYDVWKKTLGVNGGNEQVDLRLANECAWKIYDRLNPPAAQQPASGPQVTFNLGQNVHVENAFSELLSGLPERMGQILDGLGSMKDSAQRYLRSDTEALPAAAVIPGETSGE